MFPRFKHQYLTHVSGAILSLFLDQTGVRSIDTGHVFVSPALDHAAALHNKYLVAVSYGAQPMGDNQAGAPA